MSRGVGWQSALWARPLYRGPVAKRVAVSAGGASLRSVKKILSEVESLTSLCPLFPYLHVLRFFCFSAFFILHKALLSCAPPSPGPGALRGATARPETDSSTGRARPLSSQSCPLWEGGRVIAMTFGSCCFPFFTPHFKNRLPHPLSLRFPAAVPALALRPPLLNCRSRPPPYPPQPADVSANPRTTPRPGHPRRSLLGSSDRWPRESSFDRTPAYQAAPSLTDASTRSPKAARAYNRQGATKVLASRFKWCIAGLRLLVCSQP